MKLAPVKPVIETMQNLFQLGHGHAMAIVALEKRKQQVMVCNRGLLPNKALPLGR